MLSTNSLKQLQFLKFHNVNYDWLFPVRKEIVAESKTGEIYW